MGLLNQSAIPREWEGGQLTRLEGLAVGCYMCYLFGYFLQVHVIICFHQYHHALWLSAIKAQTALVLLEPCRQTCGRALGVRN